MNKTENPPMQTRSLKRRKKNGPPSKQLLDQHLIYDPMTGLWRRKLKTHPNWKLTGFLDATGYLCVSIYGAPYLAHRLAWLYMTGVWPESDIDHIDGDRTNNQWSNLRLASRTDNRRNAKSVRRKHLLPRGVSRSSTHSFRTRIKVHGRQIELGSYPTSAEASEVYQLAADLLHGEFAFHRSQGAANQQRT